MYIHIIWLGNHTFAAIRGSESYRVLSSLSTVLDDINSLIKTPTVDGYDVDVLLGGDYKVYIYINVCYASN